MEVINNENVEVLKLEIEIENTGHITNTYVVKDKQTESVCVIDPAFNEGLINKEVENIGGKLNFCIITHSHADHIAATAKLTEDMSKIYVHELDFEGLFDKTLNAEEIVGTKVYPVEKQKVVKIKDKDVINLGNTTFEIIHTPGHTKGSICLFDKVNNILYSGDTIFENSYGRTDLTNGNHDDMKQTLNMLFERFDDILVLPGHGKEFNLNNSKRKIRLLFAYKG